MKNKIKVVLSMVLATVIFVCAVLPGFAADNDCVHEFDTYEGPYMYQQEEQYHIKCSTTTYWCYNCGYEQHILTGETEIENHYFDLIRASCNGTSISEWFRCIYCLYETSATRVCPNAPHAGDCIIID